MEQQTTSLVIVVEEDLPLFALLPGQYMTVLDIHLLFYLHHGLETPLQG